jgi:uncharacterized membrane protein YhaH (DUF805 family)
MKWYLKVLRQFADFRGRARRTEYWMFTLFNLIFFAVAAALDNLTGLTFKITSATGETIPFFYGWIYLLYALFVIIPGLAVSVRRLHDVGKSGWMILIAFIPIVGAIWLLVLHCTDSQPGPNNWGPNPKEDIMANFPEGSIA